MCRYICVELCKIKMWVFSKKGLFKFKKMVSLSFFFYYLPSLWRSYFYIRLDKWRRTISAKTPGQS